MGVAEVTPEASTAVRNTVGSQHGHGHRCRDTHGENGQRTRAFHAMTTKIEEIIAEGIVASLHVYSIRTFEVLKIGRVKERRGGVSNRQQSRRADRQLAGSRGCSARYAHGTRGCSTRYAHGMA